MTSEVDSSSKSHAPCAIQKGRGLLEGQHSTVINEWIAHGWNTTILRAVPIFNEDRGNYTVGAKQPYEDGRFQFGYRMGDPPVVK